MCRTAFVPINPQFPNLFLMIVDFYLLWTNSFNSHTISKERAKEYHLEKFELLKRPEWRNTGSSESDLVFTNYYKEMEAIIYMKIPPSSNRISENITRILV